MNRELISEELSKISGGEVFETTDGKWQSSFEFLKDKKFDTKKEAEEYERAWIGIFIALI